jgi:hypothetical protein
MIHPVARATVRAAVAAGLATGLASAQVVYGYQRGAFENQTPVVRVMSMGSDRPRLTPQGNRGEFHLLVQLWVLYAAPDSSWTEAQAEDRLDQLELELATWMAANRTTANWQALDQAGRSFVHLVRYQGLPWLVEDVPVLVRVF